MKNNIWEPVGVPRIGGSFPRRGPTLSEGDSKKKNNKAGVEEGQGGRQKKASSGFSKTVPQCHEVLLITHPKKKEEIKNATKEKL